MAAGIFSFHMLTNTLQGYIMTDDKYLQGVSKRSILRSVFMGENTNTCSCDCTCYERKKQRDEKEYKDLLNRLSRIEGQVRGIRGMVENDAYCVDILTQVAAVTAALNSFNKVLLADHIRTCVAEDIRSGNDEVVDELVATLQKLMK